VKVPEPGAQFLGPLALSANGKSYATTFQRDLANLFFGTRPEVKIGRLVVLPSYPCLCRLGFRFRVRIRRKRLIGMHAKDFAASV